MSTFNQQTYDTYKKTLDDVIKKIKNYDRSRTLPTDQEKREERIRKYTQETVDSYNTYVSYLGTYYSIFDLNSKFTANEVLIKYQPKIRKTFRILGKNLTEYPIDFNTIDINNIIDFDPNSLNDSLPNSSHNSNSNSDVDSDEGAVGGRTSNKRKSIPQNIENLNDSSVPQHSPLTIHSETVNLGAQIERTQINQIHINPINSTGNPVFDQIVEETMALSPGDILKGIPDFDPKTQDHVNKFIACVDMMYVLSPNSGDLILTVARTKLITANKLGNIQNKTWAQIKAEIQSKYKLTMTFDVAQEKLLSIRQGPKESLDAYANRVKNLLDALNLVTLNDNADVQSSNRTMNELLAVRKFKQNIYDREVRVMAVAAEHADLCEAVSHAMNKSEQLNSSNVAQQLQHEKREQNHNQNNFNKNRNGNGNQNKNFEHRKNDKPDPKQDLFCRYCKRHNHTIENCTRRPNNSANKNNSEKPENKPQSSTAAVAAKQPDQQQYIEPVSGTSSQLAVQSLTLQPYHHLNS